MTFVIPTSEPKLTKEFLLSKNTEETYMSTYTGLPVKTGLQTSKLRRDTRPTVSFYRNKNGELIYHDFGTGFHENFIGVVMHINQCTYQKALRIIAEDFHYVETNKPGSVKIRIAYERLEEKPDTLIQITDRAFTSNELKWWKSFGINAETLKKYKVHACENVFLNGNYFGSSTNKNYIFGYYGGKKDGHELWRIYQPSRRSYRFLSNWDQKTMMQGAKQLPSKGDLLLITKSLKDVMVAYEFNIPAIAPCSEVMFITEQQLNRLKQRFKTIVVLYDNDLTGISNLNKIRKKYPDLKYFFIPRKYGAKDMSDYCKKYGINNTLDKVNQLKEFFLSEKKEN